MDLRGALRDPRDRLPTAMLDAVLRWPEWCFRRVDLYVLRDSHRGRVQHTADVLVLDDPAFLYSEIATTEQVGGQVIVPIAFVRKGVFSEFDSELGNGQRIPILSRRENEALSWLILRAAFDRFYGPVSENSAALEHALYDLVSKTPEMSRGIARDLVDKGEFRGQKILPRDLTYVPLLPELLHNFSDGFLLSALVPIECQNQRTIVKFSYLWEFLDSTRKNHWKTAATGRLSLDLPMTGAHETGSYHLELRVPAETICLGLKLPQDANPSRSGLETHDSNLATHHVHASYDQAPERQVAWAELAPRINTVTIFTYVSGLLLLLVMVFLGHIDPKQLENSTNSFNNSLLLTLPAILLGFVSVRASNKLSGLIGLPIRVALGIFSVLMFIVSGSLLFSEAHVTVCVWHVSMWAIAVIYFILILRPMIRPYWKVKAGLHQQNPDSVMSQEDLWRYSR